MTLLARMRRVVRRLRGPTPPAIIAPAGEAIVEPAHLWAIDAFFSDPAGGVIVQGWRSVRLDANLLGEIWAAEVEGTPVTVKAHCQYNRADLGGYMPESGGIAQLLGFCLKVDARSDAAAITLVDQAPAEPRRYEVLRAGVAHATLLDVVQGATDEAFVGLLELIVRGGELARSAEACPPLVDRTLTLPDRLVRGREFPVAVDLAALDETRGVMTVMGWCVPPRSPDAVEITVVGISRASITVFKPDVAVVDRPDLRGMFEQQYSEPVGEAVLAGFWGLGGETLPRPRTNDPRTTFLVIALTPTGDLTLMRVNPLLGPMRQHYLLWLGMVGNMTSPLAKAYVRAQMIQWVGALGPPPATVNLTAATDESGLLILLSDAISPAKARVLSTRLFSDPALRWLELVSAQVDLDVERALDSVQRMTQRAARVRTISDAGALLQARVEPPPCNVVIATASELLLMPDQTLHSLRLADAGVRVFGDTRLSGLSGALGMEADVTSLLAYHGPLVGVAAGIAWASLAPLSISLGVTFEMFVKEAALRALASNRLHLAAPFTRAGDSYSYRRHPQDRPWDERVVQFGDGMLLKSVADALTSPEGNDDAG